MIPTVALAMRAAFGPSPGSLLSCCLLFALWLPIGSAAANEVTDWSVIIEQTAIASSVKPGVILSGRNVSLMHLAKHDTLNSISRRHDSYGVHRSSPDANPRAAVMAAGHGVAVRLYPDQASSLDNLYSKMLLTIPDEPGKNEGLVLGDEIAAKIVALRADDHFDYAIPEPFVSGKGPYGSGPGAWRPAPDSPHQNANFPHASLVTPLALKNPSQFRNLLPGPLNLSSGKYSRELEEVPEYPSGHSAACGSAQIMLESAFGRSTTFAATGTTLLPAGHSRNFSSFDDASRECVEGRMLCGAHFRFSDEDALYLGQHVSRYVIRNILAAR